MPKLSWEIVLPNGAVVREPSDDASILTAPRGAVELRVVGDDGTVAHALRLDGARPIFYRRRFLDHGPRADGETRTGATVFGWAREEGSRVDGFLWAAEGGRIVECPTRLRDEKMIEIQAAG